MLLLDIDGEHYLTENGEKVTSGDIDRALRSGEQVYVSLFGSPPIRVVQVDYTVEPPALDNPILNTVVR